MPRQMKTALVLMAHGSRHAAANEDLRALADKIRAMLRYDLVVASYLELAEPDIRAACRNCIAAGATDLIPYFLSAGVHMRRDLTEMRSQLAAQYPNVQFKLAEPLGQHPLLLDVVLQRADEANESAADGL
jgi:sirohydrochlorin ferrochelatase